MEDTILNMRVPRKNMRALLPASAGSICSAGKMPMGNLAHFTATELPAFQGPVTTYSVRRARFLHKALRWTAYGSVNTWPHMVVLTCHKTKATWVGWKGADCASIPGIRECGAYADIPVLHKGTRSSIKGFCSYLGQIEGYLESFPTCEGSEDPYSMLSF